MGLIDGRSSGCKRRCIVLIVAFAYPALIFPAESAPQPAAPKAELAVPDELARLTTEAYAYPAGAKKHDALAELASLRELSGDMEGAAAAWADAAFAAGEGRDDSALLEAARCLLAMGEIDRAFADLRTVLITGRDERAVSRARYLGAQISAFSGDADARATLSAFIDDSEYADRRPATLYLLWRLTSDDSFRNRLVADHGTSPEAALTTVSGHAPVSIARTPLWLFFPVRAAPSPVAEELAPIKPPVLAQSGNAAESSAVPRAQAPASAVAPKAAEQTHPTALQIGLFRREENAKVLMKRLDAAGFKAQVTRRLVGADEYYAVTVSGGAEADETALRLKDAGFESFPLY